MIRRRAGQHRSRSSRSGPLSRRGFTILEALIAFTLFSIMMASMAHVQHAAQLTLKMVRNPSDSLLLQADHAHRVFALDCRHFLVPGFLGPHDPVIDVTNVGGDSSSGSVGFYVPTYMPCGLQEIRKVTYRLEGSNLMRVSGPATTSGAPERHSVAASGVSNLKVLLFDGQTFVEDWSGAGRRGVPQGVKLSFTVGTGASSIPCEWTRLFGGGLR